MLHLLKSLISQECVPTFIMAFPTFSPRAFLKGTDSIPMTETEWALSVRAAATSIPADTQQKKSLTHVVHGAKWHRIKGKNLDKWMENKYRWTWTTKSGLADTWMTPQEQYGGMLCFLTFEEVVTTIYYNCIWFGCNAVHPWNYKSVLWIQTLHPPLHRHSGK